jgi:hypothetical protein
VGLGANRTRTYAMIIKLIFFYGGIAVCFMASLALFIFRPPKLRARAICDDAREQIICTLQVFRSFSSVWVDSLWIPTDYVQALSASPPVGFEEMAQRLTVGPERLYDGATREVAVWSGKLDVPKRQTVDLVIPAKHPSAVSGTLCFNFQYRGFGGVGIMSQWVHVPIETKKPNHPAAGKAGIAS